MTLRRVLVHMGTSAPFTFRFLKNLKLKTSMFLNYGVKYIDRYVQEKFTQKIPVKNTLNFERYKINKFLTKRYIILILF
jgi:hypothetical protein